MHLPSFRGLNIFRLAFSINCVPIISWRFLILLYAVFASFLKFFLPVLSSEAIFSSHSLIRVDDTLVLWSFVSIPWGYYLNLLDLNLLPWFGWLECKVNCLLRFLGGHILCESSTVDQFIFYIFLCVICRYIDKFKYQIKFIYIDKFR